jgi:hypothetical protein
MAALLVRFSTSVGMLMLQAGFYLWGGKHREMTLSDKIVQVLLNMVSIAEESETRTLSYACHPGDEKGTFDFLVKDPTTGDTITMMEGLREDPVSVLQEYGCVRRARPNTVILLPSAFDAASDYQLPL